jgi:hypothetical protein
LNRIPSWLNTVVVATRETDDEGTEPGYLRIAFNWARMRAIQAHADLGSSFGPEELQSQISEIEEDLTGSNQFTANVLRSRSHANLLKIRLKI